MYILYALFILQNRKHRRDNISNSMENARKIEDPIVIY